MRLHAVPLDGLVLAASARGSFVFKSHASGDLWLVGQEKKVLCPKAQATCAGIDPNRDIVVAGWRNVVEVWNLDPEGPISWGLPDSMLSRNAGGESISAVAVHQNVVAVGTLLGIVHLYTLQGKLLEKVGIGGIIRKIETVGSYLLVTNGKEAFQIDLSLLTADATPPA